MKSSKKYKRSNTLNRKEIERMESGISKALIRSRESSMKALRYVSQQNIAFQVLVEERVREEFFRLKSKFGSNLSNMEMTVAAKLNASVRVYELLNVNKKVQEGDLSAAGEKSMFLDLIGLKIRPKTKCETLKDKKAVLDALSYMSASSRDISKFFKKYHHFEISHAAIIECRKEIYGRRNRKGVEVSDADE